MTNEGKESDNFTSKVSAPRKPVDPRLVALVQLMARRAAERDFARLYLRKTSTDHTTEKLQ